MSQHSELMGSFIRTGNFPLEANLIFSSELELLDFYNIPENKATLHKGLFKVVDDGKDLILYWAIEKNGELVFQPFKSAGTKLELDITAMNVTVGNITNGTKIPEGTTFTQFVLKMLVKPNKPIYSISSISNLGTPVEVGTPVNGAIGTYVQNQGGIITEATATLSGFIDKSEVIPTFIENKVTISFTSRIAEGNNTVNSTVKYAASNLFDEITAGSLNATKTIVGQRKLFMGQGIAPTTNSDIRASRGILYSNTFNYDLNANLTSMWIAIPSTKNLLEVKDVGALNAVITENFKRRANITIDGATTGKDAISYTIYQLSDYGPFDVAHTMNFKIS